MPGSFLAEKFLEIPDAELLRQAGQIAKENFGSRMELCSIISIRSGNCGMDCKFCAQNRANPYRRSGAMLPACELRALIERLAATPVKRIGLVSSGKSIPIGDFERLLEAVADLPDYMKRKLCVSIGQIDAARLARLSAAGIGRVHHNLETSRDFYPRVCSTQSWDDRKKTVENALNAGMEVCSGAIFGVGESWTDRIRLAENLAEIGVCNIPLNFLNPRPGTPLANLPLLAPDEALRIIALFRLILPKAVLRICGGRSPVFGERQNEVFSAGANALMTGDFLTTRGAALADDLAMLASLGLEPTRRPLFGGAGDSRLAD